MVSGNKVCTRKVYDRKLCGSKVYGRPWRTIFPLPSLLRLLAMLLAILTILFYSIGCCWSGTIHFPYLPESRSKFDFDLRRDGQIRIYSLPNCCWPKSENASKDSGRISGKRGGKTLLPYRSNVRFFNGLDLLAIDNFALLRGRSFALMTNASGKDRHLQSSLEIMIQAGLRPDLLLEPEHGLYGDLDVPGPSGIRREARYGLSILSLYGARYRPSRQHLKNIDTIVVDVMNLSVRCYTYISTLTYLMEAAEESGIELMILDRPNPYSFWPVQGSLLRKGYESFVSLAPVPFLYAMTLGEYALYMADLRFHKLYLEVVRVAGFKRKNIRTFLRHSWINPSPNIPSLETALVYPGLVFFEGVNFSLGRGTTRPFVYSGAPWLDSRRVVEQLRKLKLPGVEVSEVVFRPSASIYKNRLNRGIQITPVSTLFDPLRTGYEYMSIVRRLHRRQFRFLKRKDGRYFIDKLWGGPSYRWAILKNLSYDQFKSTWEKEARHFEQLTEKYRLY